MVDDTVLSKQHSSKIELVNYQYSGNGHDVIAEIGLVNMLWYGLESEQAVPIDYRIYEKDTDGKTKNTHFCEMLSKAKQRGIVPEAVVRDAWYSSLKNLKAIRAHGWIWVTMLSKNRKVNRNENLGDLGVLCRKVRNFPEHVYNPLPAWDVANKLIFKLLQGISITHCKI